MSHRFQASRRLPGAWRRTVNGPRDGRSGPRALSCSHPFEIVKEAGVGDAGRGRPLDRRFVGGDEAGDREGHGQAVVVEAVRVGAMKGGTTRDPDVVTIDL